MERRNLILAVTLSLAVVFAWDYFFLASHRKPRPAPSSPAASVAASVAAPAPPPIPSAAPQRKVTRTWEWPAARAELSSVGGRLVRWELANYHDRLGPRGRPVQIVAADREDQSPLWIRFMNMDDRALNYHLAEAGDAGGAFVAQAGGVTVYKSYDFSDRGYGLGLEIRLTNSGASTQRGNLEIGWSEKIEKPARSFFGGPSADSTQGLAFVGAAMNRAERFALDRETIRWAGLDHKYFLAAWIPRAAAGEAAAATVDDGGLMTVSLRMPLTEIKPGETAAYRFRVFLGPKETRVLEAFEPSLKEAIDFGWFGGVARPLLALLKFFHSMVGNYGLAIILLTVLVKALFFPLTHYSMKNMKAMQALQPELAAIKEKYKKDLQRQNVEVAQLFRRHGVNPLMGCLPMLVQLPVWIALYKVLWMSIELRHAPFLLWIQDLSARDPFYVTPVLMGVSFFVQQKLTPVADPQQEKIMLIMPIFFSFLMLNLPSGLVIYILVNNLISIVQQRIISGPIRKGATPRPATARKAT